uniref:Family with sequence similarity 210 member Aa n=1 Tax=Salmo trutta TaxID=8032 RepID=A0A674BVK9_SALTR
MALKLVWRLVNTVSKEGPEVYRIVSSAATSLMYTEKRVGPRIEPCGTPVETARGPDNSLGQVDEYGCTIMWFRRTLKQNGKVMIPLQLITSSLWFGTFYYAAMQQVLFNIYLCREVPILPQELVKLLEHSQSGYALNAHISLHIVTVYLAEVAIRGTSLSIRYQHKHSHMTTPPPIKEYLQDKMEETKEHGRDHLSRRIGDNKDKLAEKLQETKDQVFFRKKLE